MGVPLWIALPELFRPKYINEAGFGTGLDSEPRDEIDKLLALFGDCDRGFRYGLFKPRDVMLARLEYRGGLQPTEGVCAEEQLPSAPSDDIQDATPSSPVDGISSFITSISKDAVRVNGHFCDVFEGWHSTAGRVALKRPRIGGIGDEQAIIRRFEREATTWESLRHPHVLEFLGFFKRDGHLYLVSPFINNGTLAEYIASHPTNRIRLLRETADAINYLHQKGVVHGDIKASNILIDDHIHCLLCDFGLTKMTHSRTSASMAGVGTFRWQSPELWFDAPKSFSSDAYAFAMTIAEVLTGEAPFAHLNNDPAVMFAVVNKDERPPKAPTKSLSGVSYLGAWDVAEACWSKNPEERISMAVAFQRLQADPSSS